MIHHQAKNLVDLDILDTDIIMINQEAQIANLFDFTIQPQLVNIDSKYQPIRQSVETTMEHGYHLSFRYYSFTQKRRIEHYPLPNLLFALVLLVFSASQTNFFSTPQFLSATPSSFIKYLPSPPPPERPRQLLLSNNPFLPQTNLAIASWVNYWGKINNYRKERYK